VIDSLNPILLGWGRFYQHSYGAKAVFSSIDHYVWDRLRRWLRKKYPKTPRLVIRRRYWRRLPGRARYRWVDQRPVAIVADLKVGRHDLRRMRMPDYAKLVPESPVHTERCTPGSGTGTGETGGGNPASCAPVLRSLRARGDA
jgi:RNA-directed DNA polymerase